MATLFFIGAVVCLTSCTALRAIRQTEIGSKIEESTESAIEKAAEEVDIELRIDFDPQGNLKQKCYDCPIHCPKNKEEGTYCV